MELTPLDTDLIRLDQTLAELINLGLVKTVFYADEDGVPIRYKLTGRPGDEDQDEEETEEQPVRSLAVAA